MDLAAVTFVDSTGLGVIVGAAKRAAAHGGKLVLVADDDRVLHVSRITGVHKAIVIVATVEEALAVLTPKDAEPKPVAPSPSALAAQILQAQVRDLARGVFRDQIEARLDALADSGEIRGLDEDALLALAGAVERELAAAADEGRITVTITEPTP